MKDTRRVVLIIDDDAADRYLLERTLSKIDNRLVLRSVADGRDAVAYLNGEGKFADRKTYPFPTCIFVDLKMPHVDGFGVLQHLKTNPRWSIVPILVFSGSSDLDDIKKAFIAGACAYHVKPPTPEAREELCRLVLSYWATSEVPQIDANGDQLMTESAGKIGERIEQPSAREFKPS